MKNVNDALRKAYAYDDDAMHLVCAAQIVWDLKVDIKEIVYQCLTEQDVVVSSLMAAVKKILNGSSFKHQSETVMLTSRVAL